MDFLRRYLAVAMGTVAIFLLLFPFYCHAKLKGTDTLYDIRSLKVGNSHGKGGGNDSNKGDGKGDGKGSGKDDSNTTIVCTDECTDEGVISGVFVCRPKGRIGWGTQCVEPESSIVLQDKKGAVCGCCDPEDGHPSTSTCPKLCSADLDSETCPGEDESGSFDDGRFMCQQYGNPKNPSYKTNCIRDNETLDKQYSGHRCGCCDENGVMDECPQVCTIENSAECTDDEGTEGYYMCRAVGKGTFPPSPAPTEDMLSAFPTVDMLEVLPKGIKNVCIATNKTLDRQLKGDRCGCCGVDDGALTIGSDHCPKDGGNVPNIIGTTSDSNTAVACTDECTDEGGISGVFVCRPKGRIGWGTQCVEPESSSIFQDKHGAVCGCCDPEDGHPSTSTCPQLCSADIDSETCLGENESGSFDDGRFMCQQYGNPKNPSYKTNCVQDSETLEKQYSGHRCGCCDENGVMGECPQACTIENSAECTDDESTEGYYMCRAVGKETFSPSPAPTEDMLSASPTIDVLEGLPKGIKNVCVASNETLDRQLKGDRCGCCGLDDGALTIGSDHCPADDDRCSASDNRAKCDLDEDSTTKSGEGYYMCRPVGNPPRLKTVCVDDDDSSAIQLNGGECGCCDGECPEGGDEDAPLLRHRVRPHAAAPGQVEHPW